MHLYVVDILWLSETTGNKLCRYTHYKSIITANAYKLYMYLSIVTAQIADMCKVDFCFLDLHKQACRQRWYGNLTQGWR